MPNPTITPTTTDLARELAERTLAIRGGCESKFCRDGMKCTICLARALLSALASPPVEAAQGEWISVDERLPEGVTVLLVWRSSRAVTVGQRDGAFIMRRGAPYAVAAFSHWMPLPPPPAAPEARR